MSRPQFLTGVNTYWYLKPTYFCTGVTNFLAVVVQKLETAPEEETGMYQTVCLFGIAAMTYFGNFWFRTETFKGFLPMLLRHDI